MDDSAQFRFRNGTRSSRAGLTFFEDEGTLDELSHGVIPRLKIEINIGDRLLMLPEIAFDIERPHISLKTIVHTIISELRDIF